MLIIKDLPDHLHKALKARARRNHWSLNKEAASIIEQVIREGVSQLTQRTREPLAAKELEAALADDSYSHLGTLADVEELMCELRADRGAPGA